MNKFIMVKARDIACYESALENLQRWALQCLPFFAESIELIEHKASLSLVANFCRHDTGGFYKEYWHIKSNCCTCFDGLPYGPEFELENNRAEVISNLWNHDEQLLDGLLGSWALLQNGPDGGRALTDFTGMTPLYYWADSRFLAVSPRQSLLSRVCGQGQIDTFALSWLSAQSNIMGHDMPWDGVRHLPPQWGMRWPVTAGDLSFQLTPRDLWMNAQSRQKDESDIATLASNMVHNANELAKLPTQDLSIDITGGLDSRLALAIVLQSNLSGNISQLVTRGTDESPEVIVGRQVAKHVGLAHVSGGAFAQGHKPAEILERIREAMFRYDASVCPSDGLIGATTHSRLKITGTGGEIYRRNCKPHMQVVLKSYSELIDLFENYHQTTDPLTLQNQALRSAHRKQLQQMAVATFEQGVDFNDVTDVFFLRFRLPHFSGALLNNVHNFLRLYPLVNRHACLRAYQHSYRERVTDRMHFELMRELNPSLCELPFAGYTWSADIREEAAKDGLSVAKEPLKLDKPSHISTSDSSGSVLHQMTSRGWPLVREYLLDFNRSDLWDLMDRDATKRFLMQEKPKFRGIAQYKQIFALLGMQAVLVNDTRQTRSGSPTTQTRLLDQLSRNLFAEQLKPAQKPTSTIPGYLERVDNEWIVGWARDPTTPDRTPSVEVIINGEFHVQVRAEIDRQDVKRAGQHPSGKCGFQIARTSENQTQYSGPLPSIVQAYSRTQDGKKFELNHSPVFFNGSSVQAKVKRPMFFLDSLRCKRQWAGRYFGQFISASRQRIESGHAPPKPPFVAELRNIDFYSSNLAAPVAKRSGLANFHWLTMIYPALDYFIWRLNWLTEMGARPDCPYTRDLPNSLQELAMELANSDLSCPQTATRILDPTRPVIQRQLDNRQTRFFLHNDATLIDADTLAQAQDRLSEFSTIATPECLPTIDQALLDNWEISASLQAAHLPKPELTPFKLTELHEAAIAPFIEYDRQLYAYANALNAQSRKCKRN